MKGHFPVQLETENVSLIAQEGELVQFVHHKCFCILCSTASNFDLLSNICLELPMKKGRKKFDNDKTDLTWCNKNQRLQKLC